MNQYQEEWLRANLDEKNEVTYFENHQSYINELCGLGLMKPVSGKFRCKPGNFTLYSVYTLTPAGAAAVSSQDRGGASDA